MSDDCISRAEAIRIAEQGQVQGYPWQIAELSKLQSVQPKQKTGHWIYDDECHEHGHCSECGYGRVDLVNGEPHNFCRRCGAKMVEPQESEKINCKATKCENCQNHNYCDYESQESEELGMRICKYCKKPIQDNEVWTLDREGNSYHYACLCEMEFMSRDKQIYNKGRADILDKIRAEIETIIGEHNLDDYDFCSGLICARKIIDKYKAESEDKE